MKNRRFALLGLCLLMLMPVTAGAFDHGRLSFSVSVNRESSPYAWFFATAMPAGRVSLALGKGRSIDARDFAVTTNGGSVESTGPGLWTMHAPGQPGVATIEITRRSTRERMTVTVFTLIPASEVENGYLNGYRIGAYPKQPFRGLPVYQPPRGFIEVTPDTENIRVSPHFTLGQFICKQAGGPPRYIVLRPLLLFKLEGLLEEVNANGVQADSFYVMSGYRTPYYNASIKNVVHSRHVWGGAADIFIDVSPQDGRMDDLNGDGKINKIDALWLYRLAARYAGSHHRPELVGGVGAYQANSAHGPFVHVDVRGSIARWGAGPE